MELHVINASGTIVGSWGFGVWYDGHINGTIVAPADIGIYTLAAYQKKNRRGHMKLKAETILTVT